MGRERERERERNREIESASRTSLDRGWTRSLGLCPAWGLHHRVWCVGWPTNQRSHPARAEWEYFKILGDKALNALLIHYIFSSPQIKVCVKNRLKSSWSITGRQAGLWAVTAVASDQGKSFCHVSAFLKAKDSSLSVQGRSKVRVS